MAKQLHAYSKVFGKFNTIADAYDLFDGVLKGINTSDWKDAVNKFGPIAAGCIAGEIVAVAFLLQVPRWALSGSGWF